MTETNGEQAYKSGPLPMREAFRAGASSESRHHQEEIPPHLRAMVNRVRAVACRPGATNRHPEDILAEVLVEFRDRSLEAWSA